MNKLTFHQRLAILAIAWLLTNGGGGSVIGGKATAATYVYEKDEGGVPAAVMSGLNKLNTERKIVATEFEQDTTDGDGKTPAQYVVALEAAKKNGLPSLVATAGSRVVKVTKNPKTEDDVLKGVP